MADASSKRNGVVDGDDRSGNRKRKSSSFLDLFNANSEVDGDDRSSDVEFHIKIKTATGKIISIIVKDSDTIGSIKLKIQHKERISFDHQELIFKGMVLEDINTLANLRIKKDSTLKLVRKASVFMNISINNLEGKITYSLEVKPTDTIASVKEKIKMKEGIAVDEQVLIFNKMVLGDDGTLFDFHINTKSTLTLIRKLRGLMKIFINTVTGETITQEVKPSYTIDSIKAKIQDKVRIPCDEQELIYNELVLHNTNTVAEYNIKRESTLTLKRLSRGPMQIFIKILDGMTFTLDVIPTDTIYNIKAKIHDKVHIHKINIPCDEQELFFNEMVLHNIDTLADYNIKRESTLTLVAISRGFMQIFIEIRTGKTITLEVKPSDTINNVKAKILDKGAHLSWDMRLTYNGKFLADGPTLADYNIKRESTLTIVHGVMQIFIKIQTGNTITLEVEPSDTIHNVKAKIFDKEANLPRDLRLAYNGKFLEDGCTVADCHIDKDSTVHVYPLMRFSLESMPFSMKSMHIFIKTLTGKTTTLDVKPSETIHNVKSKFEEKEGIPPSQQVLLWNGNKLVDSVTLAHYHITEESTIHLVIKRGRRKV